MRLIFTDWHITAEGETQELADFMEIVLKGVHAWLIGPHKTEPPLEPPFVGPVPPPPPPVPWRADPEVCPHSEPSVDGRCPECGTPMIPVDPPDAPVRKKRRKPTRVKGTRKEKPPKPTKEPKAKPPHRQGRRIDETVRTAVRKYAASHTATGETIGNHFGISGQSVSRILHEKPTPVAPKDPETKEWLDNPMAARKRPRPEPAPPQPEDGEETPPAPPETGTRVATMTNAVAVLDALNRHFAGELYRTIAEKAKVPQPLVISTVHRCYVLMGEPFSPVGPPNPRAKALWQDEMGPQGRAITANRIAEGR